MSAEIFFLSAPEAAGLYDALTAHIRTNCGDFRVQAKKTQLSLANRHVFACVSLPPPRKTKPASQLILTLGLPYRAVSPRFTVVSEPYPGRWTHHIPIASRADIDDEVTAWLRDAYGFAAIK